MKNRYCLLILLALIAFMPARAERFFDNGTPDRLLTFGVQVGATSSGMKADVPAYGDNATFSWKGGFTVGATVDLNVRNFFTIQPGFFYESHNYKYSLIEHNPLEQSLRTDLGNACAKTFSIPVLLSFRFNLTRNLRWNVDVGPYFQFGLGGNDEVTQIYVKSGSAEQEGAYVSNTAKRDYYGDGDWQHRSFDWGAKVGTGLCLFDHYTFNIHYQRGFRNVSANKAWSMHSKSCLVTFGYLF